MGIRTKLLLPFLMAFAVMAGIAYWYWQPQYIQHELETWDKHQNQILNAIKPYLVRDILAGDLASLHTTLSQEVVSNRQDWRALVLFNDKGQQIYQLGEPPVTDETNLVRFRHTLKWQGDTVGTLVLTADFGHELAEEQENVFRLAMATLMVLGVFIVLATFWQNLWIRIPINRLQRAAASLAEGDASVPLPRAGNDELGHLTHTFGSMRDRLQTAQDEVQTSENRYRAVFEGAVDGIITIDQYGRIETFNLAAEKIFGYRADEIIGQPFVLLMPEPYCGEYKDYMRAYLETGKAQILGQTREVQGRRKDNSVLPMSLAVSEIKINNSHLFCGVVSDITERHKAEHDLKQSNDLMASLVDNLQEGILVEDDNRHILQANQLFCDMFNIDTLPSALTGRDSAECITRGKKLFVDPDRFFESNERCVAWKEVVIGEELELADSRVFERDYIPVLFRTDGQNVNQAHLWTYRDITGRKRIEMAVQNQSEQLETAAAEERALSTLLRLALQPLEMEVLLDKVLNEILDAVPWLKSLHKGAIFLTEDEGRGQNLILATGQELGAELCGSCTQVPFGHCLCGHAAVEHTILFSSDVDNQIDIHSDGMIPHGQYNVPLMQGDTVLGMIVLYLPQGYKQSEQEIIFLNRLADVVSMGISRCYANSALLHAKAEAEAAVHAKSAFLATMSHEIRTPMNGVLGMAQILANTELSGIQHQYLDTITESGKALLVVINDILDFSKIEAGKLTLDPVAFDLERATHEVCQLLAGAAREKGLELIMRYDPSCPRRLNGDAGRLRQILMNLVGNAIKFTAQGHVLINIRCLQQDDKEAKIQIEVQDTGIGISKDIQSSLFSAFTQADGSTTRRFGGTGLGLAISRQLVDLMGGEIGVESCPDEGSTFRFTLGLPLAGKVEPLVRAELEGVRVLLVDDHPVNRKVLCEQLKPLGMEVEACADAESAMTMLHQATDAGVPFELAVLDYLMPDQDGEQLARSIRSIPCFSDLPLLMLTSGAQRGDTRRLNEAGFNGYLIKPVRSDILAETLAAVLGATRQGDMTRLITAYDVAVSDESTGASAKVSFTGKVLLVEDVEFNQLVATTMLRQTGLVVDLAGDGEEALLMWRAGEYDLILMDCQMPVMDGYQATRAIRQEEEQHRGRHVPIVALTANAQQSDRDKCLAAGMDDFLAKPFEQHALMEVLRDNLKNTSTQGVGKKQPASGTAKASASGDEEHDCLDQTRFNQLLALMGEDIEPLIISYTESAAGKLNILRAAAESGQADTLESESHALCGISGNVGARHMFELAGELEQRARENHIDDALDRVDRLDASYIQTKERMWNSMPAVATQTIKGGAELQKEVIDPGRYEDMRTTLGEQAFAQLIPIFMSSVENMLDELLLASEGGDNTEVCRLAHSIKSAGANVGAMQLSELACSLEIKANENDLNEGAGYIDRLKEAYDEVRQALVLKSA